MHGTIAHTTYILLNLTLGHHGLTQN